MKLVFATAKKCQQFSNIFANLKAFTDNVAIYFKPDQVYIQSMDDSHCSLFECRLMSKWFKTYDFDPASDMGQIAINIVMLNKVLNTWIESQELSTLKTVTRIPASLISITNYLSLILKISSWMSLFPKPLLI